MPLSCFLIAKTDNFYGPNLLNLATVPNLFLAVCEWKINIIPISGTRMSSLFAYSNNKKIGGSKVCFTTLSWSLWELWFYLSSMWRGALSGQVRNNLKVSQSLWLVRRFTWKGQLVIRCIKRFLPAWIPPHGKGFMFSPCRSIPTPTMSLIVSGYCPGQLPVWL